MNDKKPGDPQLPLANDKGPEASTPSKAEQGNPAASGNPSDADSDAAPESTQADVGTAKVLANPVWDPNVKEKPASQSKRPAKPPRPRRGPPADGGDEDRVVVILTTSKLNDTSGSALRRGQAASVPKRRLAALLKAGKVRTGSASEIEAATRRFGRARVG
ncbi:hypothetical protein [Brevundimonas sp.]|uniref:hypothetical protein n=1 Tax=Brevundimonas sp. TaxID=1871086 RepID=UPI0028A1FDD3|nr:hypothetical protein [Brevundimonas sp.]